MFLTNLMSETPPIVSEQNATTTCQRHWLGIRNVNDYYNLPSMLFTLGNSLPGQCEHNGNRFLSLNKGWLIQRGKVQTSVGFKSERGMSVEGDHRGSESKRRMRLDDT